MADKRIRSLPLLVMIAAVAVSIIFWSYYAYSNYRYFADAFFDMGQPAYNMYYVLHYLPLSNPLQFFAYAQHIAVDQLLVLPIFALYQSSLTLLFVQAVVVSLTGLLMFYIVRELTGNDRIGMLLGLAFLASPGVTGLLVFDYHAEFLILPFFMLTFYFYMKKRWNFFIPSVMMLLLTVDTVVPVVFTLGLGLLYYELVYKRNNRVDMTRVKMALSVVILSGLLFFVYMAMQISLLVGYGTGAYSTPLYLKIVPYEPIILNSLLNRQVIALPYFNTSTYPVLLIPFETQGVLSNPPVVVVGLFAGLLFLAPLVLVDPIIAIIIDLPWLAELLTGHLTFGLIGNQYLSYVICGTFVSAILCFLLMKEHRGVLFRIKMMHGKKNEALSKRSVWFIILIISVILFTSIIAYIATRPAVLTYMFLGVNQSQAQCDAQLYSIIGSVPQNSSLLTNTFIFPHLINREYIETFESYGPYFNASYAVVDFGSCLTADYNFGGSNYSANDYQYLEQNGYELYMQNGSAMLYKRAS